MSLKKEHVGDDLSCVERAIRFRGLAAVRTVTSENDVSSPQPFL